MAEIGKLIDAMSRRLASAVNVPETILMARRVGDLDAAESVFFQRQLEVIPSTLYANLANHTGHIYWDSRAEREPISTREIDRGGG